LNSAYSVITPIDTVLDLVREDEDIPTGSIKKQ
jgi:hypothetical protein